MACRDELEYYYFRLHQRGINVAFLAGIHGNEPAAAITLRGLLEARFFERLDPARLPRIKGILVVPNINECGLRDDDRYFYYGGRRWDLNRSFWRRGLSLLQQLRALLRQCQVVIDFHEGWGFHIPQPQSLGSTLSPGPGALDLARHLALHLNARISDANKRFLIVYPDIPRGSLMDYLLAQPHPPIYVLVETSGQNDVQPLAVRRDQVLTIIGATLAS